MYWLQRKRETEHVRAQNNFYTHVPAVHVLPQQSRFVRQASPSGKHAVWQSASQPSLFCATQMPPVPRQRATPSCGSPRGSSVKQSLPTKPALVLPVQMPPSSHTSNAETQPSPQISSRLHDQLALLQESAMHFCVVLQRTS